MRIRFVGPLLNTNGYAEFGRYFIRALHERKVDYLPVITPTETNMPDLGELGDIILSASKRDMKYDVNIINLTPELAVRQFVKDAPNVIFTMFETTRIPDAWVTYCNTANAIFVPCEWNKEVFEQSGVTVPVYVVSPGIFSQDFVNDTVRSSLIMDSDVRYKFYSIFQWTERKNPLGLLRSYYSQFTGCDDVVLILKTYMSQFSTTEQHQLKNQILAIKKDLKLKHYPKVSLLMNMLSSQQMSDLHKQCDCFVLPHRSEGFGMPHMEAMGWGNPVITTGFSGNMDFMTNESALLLPYQMTPVYGLPWVPWYVGDMDWAEPDLGVMKEKMQFVYDNPGQAAKIGQVGKEYVNEVLSWDIRMDKLLTAVGEICG